LIFRHSTFTLRHPKLTLLSLTLVIYRSLYTVVNPRSLYVTDTQLPYMFDISGSSLVLHYSFSNFLPSSIPNPKCSNFFKKHCLMSLKKDCYKVSSHIYHHETSISSFYAFTFSHFSTIFSCSDSLHETIFKNYSGQRQFTTYEI